jgi:hypothetical protein
LADLGDLLTGIAEASKSLDRDTKIAARLALALYYYQAASAFKPGSTIRATLEGLFDENIRVFDGPQAIAAHRQTL